MKQLTVMHVTRQARGGMLYHVRQVAREQSNFYRTVTVGPSELAPADLCWNHHKLDLGDGWHINDFRQARNLARLIRKEKVDLLHLHSLKAFLTGALASSLAPIPAVVVTFHNFLPFIEMKGWRSNVFHYLGRFLRKKNWHVTVVSDALGRQIKEGWGLPDDKVTTIYNGLYEPPDLYGWDKKVSRASLGLPEEGILIGSLGRMIPGKGYDYLLEAFTSTSMGMGPGPGTGKDSMYLVLGGDGPQLEGLCKKAEALGLAENCLLPGFIEDKWAFLNALDIYVQPSLEEGLGIALLEALWAGLPAVASKVGGIPEVLNHGQCGMLVPPADVKALGQALTTIVQELSKGRNYVEQGHSYVEDNFQSTAMMEKIDHIYNDLLRKNIF